MSSSLLWHTHMAWLQPFEADHLLWHCWVWWCVSPPQVSSLEAGEAQAPKAPARLVAALEERLEALAAQQVGRRAGGGGG